MNHEAQIAACLMEHMGFLNVKDLPLLQQGEASPEPQATHYRLTHFYVPPVRATISRWILYRGTLQVDVMYQDDGTGVLKALDMAGDVADHYAEGLRLEGRDLTVQINDPPAVGTPLHPEGWIQVPVSVRWETRAKRKGD